MANSMKDLFTAAANARNALDNLEVQKGVRNAALLKYTYDEISALTRVLESMAKLEADAAAKKELPAEIKEE